MDVDRSKLIVLFLTGLSPVITEIAAVLLIGLVMDLINSWLLNAGIFRWHAERGAKAPEEGRGA